MSTKDIIEYSLIGAVIVGIFIICITWIKSPSTGWSSAETEYTNCLKLVLEHGNIVDAETMCKDRKK